MRNAAASILEHDPPPPYGIPEARFSLTQPPAVAAVPLNAVALGASGVYSIYNCRPLIVSLLWQLTHSDIG